MGFAGSHPRLPGLPLPNTASEYMSFLPVVLALRVPGDSQVWGAERWLDDRQARAPLQSIQPRWVRSCSMNAYKNAFKNAFKRLLPENIVAIQRQRFDKE